MKTTILATAAILALASLMSVSCDKTDRPSKGTIGFKIVSNETKGTIVTTENITSQHGAFYVDLIEDKTNKVITNDVDGSPVLGEKVTWSNGVWTLANMTYWKDRTINAWAYSPAVLKGGSIGVITPSDEDGVVSHVYDGGTGDPQFYIDTDRTKMTFNFLVSDKAATQDDLLFAYTARCTNKTTGTNGKTPGQIPLHFYHALSAIQFKVGAVSDATKYEFDASDAQNVKITGIRINNIRRAGTCEFSALNAEKYKLNPAAATFDDIFNWNTTANDVYDRSFGSVSQAYNVAVTGTGADLAVSNNDEGIFFLIPQTMNTASGLETSLTISWTKNGETMPDRTAVITMDPNDQLVEWKAGYRYLYTIRIGVKAADTRVDLTVLPWNTTSMDLDYDQGPAVADNGKLTLTPLASEGTTIAVADGSDGVTGRFTLGEPQGAEWLVSVSDPEHFDVSGANGSKNPATGIVDGETAIFYITKKAGVERTEKFTTKVHITLMMPDGSYVNLDDTNMLDTQKWSVVLNPLN